MGIKAVKALETRKENKTLQNDTQHMEWVWGGRWQETREKI